MARQREFDPDRALQETLMVFWENGYEDTSIGDIVAATGVSRYGLYSTFGDKRELYLRALQLYSGLLRGWMWSPLLEANASLPHVRRFLEQFVEVTDENAKKGCFLCNTAAELAEDRDCAAQTQRYYEELSEAIVGPLNRAVELGELGPQFNTAGFAATTVATIVGGSIMRKTVPGRVHARRAVEALLLQLP